MTSTMDLLLTGDHFYYIVSTNCQQNTMLSTKLEDLPNEIITKVLSYLDLRNLFCFGHISKRTRSISRDKAVWRKLTIHNQNLKSRLLKFMLRNGCKFLKLINVKLKGFLHLRKASRLQELSLDRCTIKTPALEEFLASCHSLKKFVLRGIDLSDVNEHILKLFVLQNKNTLQTLDLRMSKRLTFGSIKFIVHNCNELTEVTIIRYFYDKHCEMLSEASINYLAKNLTEKVVKLNLGSQRYFKDEHAMKLIKRCKRITELNLNGTSITQNSLTCIIENLKHSLVILRLCNTKLYLNELLQLRSMSKLKVLNCSHLIFCPNDLKHLKEALPDLSILLKHSKFT